MNFVNSFVQYLRSNCWVFYTLCLLFGVPTLIQFFLEIAKNIFKQFRKRLDLQSRYGKNSWALITGSSQGIGKQLARSLARQNLNILLTARTQQKLKQTQKQLQQQFPSIQVHYKTVDFIKESEKTQIKNILPFIYEYDISVLVNNVGVDYLGSFGEMSVDEIIRLIKINVIVLGELNYIFVKLFQERRKKKEAVRSAILNVSSMGAEFAMPLFTVYSASKAYVDRLTLNLSHEYPQIDFMSLRPGQVKTKMTQFKQDIFTVNPDKCAEGTIADLGYDLETNGHLNHKIQSWFYCLFPEWIFNWVFIRFVGPDFVNFRKSYFQKLKKE